MHQQEEFVITGTLKVQKSYCQGLSLTRSAGLNQFHCLKNNCFIFYCHFRDFIKKVCGQGLVNEMIQTRNKKNIYLSIDIELN